MFCKNLVFNILPSSVLPSSGIAKSDFWHVLPKSSLGKMDVLPKSVLPSAGAQTKTNKTQKTSKTQKTNKIHKTNEIQKSHETQKI